MPVALLKSLPSCAHRDLEKAQAVLKECEEAATDEKRISG